MPNAEPALKPNPATRDPLCLLKGMHEVLKPSPGHRIAVVYVNWWKIAEATYARVPQLVGIP
jgi:hypothetical protein